MVVASEGDLSSLDEALAGASGIVDALFGIGLARPLGAFHRAVIAHVNRRPRANRLAVDVPSGMEADSGEPLPVAVRADVTAALGARGSSAASPPPARPTRGAWSRWTSACRPHIDARRFVRESTAAGPCGHLRRNRHRARPRPSPQRMITLVAAPSPRAVRTQSTISMASALRRRTQPLLQSVPTVSGLIVPWMP